MKLSVLVCAYNCENTIEKCIHSILAQPIDDYEILVVNDGSLDNTPAILAQLSNQYAQIRIIHQDNRGVAAARNMALQTATGDYITYLDSDDYLTENSYATILEKCEEGYDIVCFDAYKVSNNGIEPFKMVVGENGEISASQYYLSDPAPWNKFMRRSLFYGLMFPRGLIYEDYAIIPSLANHANKIYYLNKNVVNYVLGDESIMRSATYKDKSKDILKATKYLYEHSDLSRFKDEFEKVLYDHVLVSSCRYFISYQKIENANLCGMLVKHYCPKVLRNKYLSLSLKDYFIGWCFLNNHADWVYKLVHLKR